MENDGKKYLKKNGYKYLIFLDILCYGNGKILLIVCCEGRLCFL